MTRNIGRALAAAWLVLSGALALPAPTAAMQLLEAIDHAELSAEISAREVNRIALIGDRVARVVRAPDGYAVEHDAATGDLWLRNIASVPSDGTPVTLFLGTEKGFTYRLTLTPSDRDAAQILIRNADALPDMATGIQDTAGLARSSDPRIGVRGRPHIAALVKLVRAVARREALAGYEIAAGGSPPAAGVRLAADVRLAAGVRLIETWRGPRLRALVLEADFLPSAGTPDAADLAGTIGQTLSAGRVTALWLAAPGSGPGGGRLAVAVVETVRAESSR